VSDGSYLPLAVFLLLVLVLTVIFLRSR